LTVVISLAALPVLNRRGEERATFVSSATFLASMLAGAAAALYPILLPASGDSALNITIFTASTGHHALGVGLVWWTGGMLLAVGYFVFVYRMFRGKVTSGHSVYR